MEEELPEMFFEIHQDLPREGPGRNQYTQKAFRMLPERDDPRILDIGCGPGGQTMELARLSKGRIVALDTHQPYLDRLEKKIEEAGLSHRMKAVNASMFDMDFPEASFDIIWAEGSIYIIGFERGLKEWRRFIKPDGFLAVHEMTWLKPDPPGEILDYWIELYPGITAVEQNLGKIADCGYRLIGHFTLPEDAWWVEYYGPLELRLENLRKKYSGDEKALEVIEGEQQEIDIYRKYKQWYGSVFFVMQKR